MSWYKTGSIAVSGVTVTGTGTNWTDNKMGIGPGQALLIPGAGTVKMYEIARVDSATQITLTSSAGTLAAGQAYAIMSFYTDSVPDFARRLSTQLSYYQSQMDGWQQIMTGTGSISITAPDGTQVTISSFKKLTDDMANKADKVNGAVAVAQGGTGAKSAADARKNLGLGSSATRNAYSSAGDMLSVGDFDVGATLATSISDLWDKSLGTRFCRMTPTTSGGTGSYAMTIRLSDRIVGSGPSPAGQQAFTALAMAGKDLLFTTMSDGVSSGWLTVYNSGNTTKASDGTLKAASPVVKIFSDGSFETNAESEGCTVTRLSIGEYLIEGCKALNSDAEWGGWDGGFDIPTDKNKQPLVWLDYEVNADGSVLVKTYHRTYPDAPAFAKNLIGEKDGDGHFTETVKDGEPVDLPADQFVSVRVEMPADSIYNTNLSETQKLIDAAREAEEQN